MRKIIFACLIIVTVLINTANAQAPLSNVYLFDYQLDTDGSMTFSNPKLLTNFNPNGYNNQPYWINNSELYLTVQTPDDTSQTEIYSLNVDTEVKTRITDTPEGEYSPTRTPEGYTFSVVRVELDENRTQRLWKFPMDRSGRGEPVFPYIRNVGYHAWLSAKEVALYALGQPNYLMVADVTDGSTVHLATGIGRSLHTLPNGNIAYLHKVTNNNWVIKELDARTKTSKSIANAIAGSEDFAVTPDGTFLMASDSKLFKYKPTTDDDWRVATDFSSFGLRNVTRIAVSKNGRIALVSK